MKAKQPENLTGDTKVKLKTENARERKNPKIRISNLANKVYIRNRRNFSIGKISKLKLNESNLQG